MDSKSHRPLGYTGRGDRYLPEFTKSLKHMLMRTQRALAHNILCLPSGQAGELVDVLVEFAEDVHNDIGFWNSLEQLNFEFFGIPLPFILQTTDNIRQKLINRYRIEHLMWVLYSE